MIIDGRAIAKSIYATVAERVRKLSFQPVFCDVLVGDDPASKQYVNLKARTAESVGIAFLPAQFSISVDEAELIKEISALQRTSNLCGLIVQLPLPFRFNTRAILDAINPRLDVDCLSTESADQFYSGEHIFTPPTAAAVMALLDSVTHSSLKGHAVVIGQGDLVGKPIAHMLLKRGLTVDIITKATVNPEYIAREADILVSGAGSPSLVTQSWVKPGAIVIDAGTAENEGSIVGDVERDSVEALVSFLSPTPGGVGPVTVAKLLENVVAVAEAQSRVGG